MHKIVFKENKVEFKSEVAKIRYNSVFKFTNNRLIPIEVLYIITNLHKKLRAVLLRASDTISH